jgi:hypothetical protein
MSKNRYLGIHSSEELTALFTKTIRVIDEAIGKTAFRLNGSFVAAIYDSVMVGVALRMKKGVINQPRALSKKYTQVLQNDKFLESVSVHTTDEDNVHRRLALVKAAFDDIP